MQKRTEVDELDVAQAVENLIREANRRGIPIRVVVEEPTGPQSFLTRLACRSVRRVLDMFENTYAVWRRAA